MINILIKINYNVSCLIICLQNLRIFILTMHLLNLTYSLYFFMLRSNVLAASIKQDKINVKD